MLWIFFYCFFRNIQVTVGAKCIIHNWNLIFFSWQIRIHSSCRTTKWFVAMENGWPSFLLEWNTIWVDLFCGWCIRIVIQMCLEFEFHGITLDCFWQKKVVVYVCVWVSEWVSVWEKMRRVGKLAAPLVWFGRNEKTDKMREGVRANLRATARIAREINSEWS